MGSAASSWTIGSSRQEVFEPRKRKPPGNTTIKKAFSLAKREELQEEIARMFYSGGLPFHLARNHYYVQAFALACKSGLDGFVPLGYNVLRIALLEREKANVEKLLEPIKETWKSKGVSLVSDGWMDPQRRPLINMMAISEGGPMFIKAVNCEHEVKDRFYIANLIKEAIVEVGPQYVVQVITDNAAVCRAAGLIIQGQYHNIFWTPCVVHTLNLALKNICAPKNSLENQNAYEECSWISEIASDALIIKNFIMNHSMRLAIYNQFVKLRLLSIATTRFASVVVMLKRFDAIKQGLKAMVVSEEWSMYKDDDVGKANFVKEKVLDDGWWEKIAYILSFTEPIYNMLRETDTDKPTLHSVYEMWDSMIVQVKKVIYAHERKQGNEESTFYNVVHNILVTRWSKSTTPLHCLAHSLNPRFYTPTWINGGPNRVEPHVDAEISLERKKCFIKLFPNEEERRLVNIEFGKFSGMMDEFSDPSTLRDRCVMEPKLWWIVHGSSTPKLQALAIRLLSQPSSSSGCERNWSTYSFINSLKRNKLTPKRAEDLVFVHSNLRLLSRKSIQYMQGETRMWDIAGDAFESLDDVGVLEIANLSLDEPALEAVVFNNEAIDDDALPT